MRRKKSKRPPFENRWTSVRKGWCWYLELEALGVEETRLRLVLQDAPQPLAFPYPEIPTGFVRDWLRFHDRRARREIVRWTVTAALMAAVATAAAISASWSAISRAL